MIPRADLSGLPPARRAELIYAEAQSELQTRLWRAALGDADPADRGKSPLAGTGMRLDSLLELATGRGGGAAQGACGCACHCSCHGGGDVRGLLPLASAPTAAALQPPVSRYGDVARGGMHQGTPPPDAIGGSLALGPNAGFEPALALAEAKTGIPASAIAAIVDAEAAKRHDGSWNPLSRNPRSSAAGLGQFLSGTWQGLAETPGTWLNQAAAARGWLDAQGKIAQGARAELLALRYDPQASILTTADLARINLDRLERDGIRVRTDSETLAKAAYLSHHLGLGDARKFLGGGIGDGRARTLLAAQIGSTAADQRINAAGGASAAHREWLLTYIERRIRPESFAS